MKTTRALLGLVLILTAFASCDFLQATDQTLPEQLFQIDLQNGLSDYDGCEDTWIRSDYPTRNYGSNTSLLAGYSGIDRDIRNRILIRFMLKEAPIPVDARIQKAFLYLYNETDDDDGFSADFQAYKLLKDWYAGYDNGTDNSPFVTWNYCLADINWATPGGDFSDEPVSGGFVNSIDEDGFICLSLEPAMVQDWIENPPENYGILVKQINEDERSVPYFVSSDTIDNEFRRPKLSLFYSLD